MLSLFMVAFMLKGEKDKKKKMQIQRRKLVVAKETFRWKMGKV